MKRKLVTSPELEEAARDLREHEATCPGCRAYRRGKRHARCIEGGKLARLAAGEPA